MEVEEKGRCGLSPSSVRRKCICKDYTRPFLLSLLLVSRLLPWQDKSVSRTKWSKVHRCCRLVALVTAIKGSLSNPVAFFSFFYFSSSCLVEKVNRVESVFEIVSLNRKESKKKNNRLQIVHDLPVSSTLWSNLEFRRSRFDPGSSRPIPSRTFPSHLILYETSRFVASTCNGKRKQNCDRDIRGVFWRMKNKNYFWRRGNEEQSSRHCLETELTKCRSDDIRLPTGVPSF